MTTGQEHAWQTLSPTYLITVERSGGDTTVAAGHTLLPAEHFNRVAPLVVEIGTGDGEALIHAAEKHPELNFLGIEVYQAGLARTMLNADRLHLTNIKLIEANAPEVLKHLLPEASVHELRVYFPDPWHKAKHNKRRLIAPPFIELADRTLAPDGVIRLATDWQEYADQMREVFDDAAPFERDFTGEWAERFAGRPVTNFERKGIAKGRDIRDLTYRRRSTQ